MVLGLRFVSITEWDVVIVIDPTSFAYPVLVEYPTVELANSSVVQFIVAPVEVRFSTSTSLIVGGVKSPPPEPSGVSPTPELDARPEDPVSL